MTIKENNESPAKTESTVQKVAQKLSFLHYLAIGILAVCLVLSVVHHH